MSIAIDSMKCRACGKCLDVCPGSLIVRGEDKKAVIRYPKDCWGCASCIKECPFIRKEICYTGELKKQMVQ